MKVVIDDKSGFCFGVVRAIDAAQSALEQGAAASLGDIVHNSLEVSRLEKLGLKTIDYKELSQSSRVIIRAHGEPPATYKLAHELGIELIDATCPVVAMLQKRVKKVWDQMQPINGQVIIIGKKGHAEVVGLEGQTDGNAIVIESIDDLTLIDFNRPISIFAQTTQSLDAFNTISEMIAAQAVSECEISDTICRQVSGRAPHLREFAKQFDVILFVCGKKSSNGKALYDICRDVNTNSFMVESYSDINSDWLQSASSVGICGATSTPLWQMQSIAEFINKFSI